MNKTMIKTVSKLGPKANKMLLTLKKHAPTIVMVTGIGCTVAGVGTAVRAGFKIAKHSEEEKNKATETVDNEKKEPVKEEGGEKKVNVSSEMVRYTLKQLSIPFGLCAIGTTCIVGSHRAMSRRNAALAASYFALDQSFKTYQARVKEKVGGEKEAEIRTGLPVKVDGIDTDPIENDVFKYEDMWIPAEACRYWSDSRLAGDTSMQSDLAFLKARQDEWNWILNSRGHVVMNEIYNDLGFEPTRAGSTLGWINTGESVSYIDFNIMPIKRTINGQEVDDILLTFNFEGPILSYFEEV